MQTLSLNFNLENPSRGAYLALICGVLVEQGCDPLSIAQPLTEQLGKILASSVQLVTAFKQEITVDEDEDPGEVFEAARERLAETMPVQDLAWEALEKIWRPAIAVYSASAESRIAAVHLLSLAEQLRDYHEAGYWLPLMLKVMDEEPVLVIEPQTQLGVIGQMSGVADNFQLNVLLMDAFPAADGSSPQRVCAEVAAVAKGDGPAQTEESVKGVWNLYAWQAIQQDGTLPDAGDFSSRNHWIWNEGLPSDIPVFRGHRVVLLGPASYSRGWSSQRPFERLNASVQIERQLSREEIADWLQQMIDAKPA